MKHDYKLPTVLESGDVRSTGKGRGELGRGFEPGTNFFFFFFY